MVLHVVPCLNLDIGGPARSVSRLAAAQSGTGQEVRVLALDYPEHGPLPALAGVKAEIIPAGRWTRPLRGWSPAFGRALDAAAASVALIHNHGIWMWPNHQALCAARRHRVPVVCSPRGMLSPWAMAYHRAIKQPVWQLWQKRDLERVTAFHATSAQEAEDIRALGFKQPVAVIPNGVDLEMDAPLSREELDGRVAGLAGKRFLLFLSRLHPKKGLRELVEAWARVAPGYSKSHHLVIAGPDLTGERDRLESWIRQADLTSSITITGSVEGSLKQGLLTHADALVLPTHEENFGIVVAEALAAGTPVVTTRHAPWAVLEERGMGWWIELDAECLAATLAEVMRSEPMRLKNMGERGRAYVRDHLAWESIASGMREFYVRVTGRGTCPPSAKEAGL